VNQLTAFPQKTIGAYLMRSHAAPWVVLAMLGAVFIGHASSYWTIVDDSFISYRYAENLVAGHGLVFNIGEPVEGYTNFLWTLLLAASNAIGADTAFASQVLGALFGLLLLPVVYISGRSLLGFGRWMALVPCVLMAGNAALARWAGSGLETVPYTTLFTLGVTLALIDLRDNPRLPLSGVIAGLAALMRPEAAGLFAFLWISAALAVRKRLRVLLAMVLGFSALTIPHLTYRLSYYGLPLPNTYYAKVELSTEVLAKGLSYVGDFFLCHGPWALLALIGLWWFQGDRGKRYLVLLPLSTLFIAFAYVATVGGDFYEFWRFCVPYLPWLILLVCAGACSLGAHMGRERTVRSQPPVEVVLTLAVALSILVPAKVWPMVTDRFNPAGWEFSNRALEELGLWLKESYPESTVIAVTWLGRVPYFSGFKAIDMLGIADAHIAQLNPPEPIIVTPLGKKYEISKLAGVAGHGKYDPEYILEREPDLVLLEITFPEMAGTLLISDLRTQLVFEELVSLAAGPALPSLLARADFRRRYAPRMAQVSQETLFVYFERDRTLERFEAAVRQQGDDPRLHFNLAAQYRRQGLLSDAVDSLERAIALDPTHLGSHLNRGYFLLEAKRPMAAVAAFQGVVSTHPQEPTAVYGLALAQYTAQNYASAISHWTEFLRRFPAHPYAVQAKKLLAEARQQVGSS
jgi:hypothetical protein